MRGGEDGEGGEERGAHDTAQSLCIYIKFKKTIYKKSITHTHTPHEHTLLFAA